MSKPTSALMARALFAGTLNVVFSVEQSDEGVVLGMVEEVGSQAPDTAVGEDVVFAAAIIVAVGAVDLEL